MAGELSMLSSGLLSLWNNRRNNLYDIPFPLIMHHDKDKDKDKGLK